MARNRYNVVVGDWVRYLGASRRGWFGRVTAVLSKNGHYIRVDWVTPRGLWKSGFRYDTYYEDYAERFVPTPEQEARWLLARISN